MVHIQGRLHIRVARGKRIAGSGDELPRTFVEVKVDTATLGRTSTSPRTEEPQWDRSFRLDVKGDVQSVNLYVWEYKRFRSNEFLGVVCVDMERIMQDRRRKQCGLSPIRDCALNKVGSMELKVWLERSENHPPPQPPAYKALPSKAYPPAPVGNDAHLRPRNANPTAAQVYTA